MSDRPNSDTTVLITGGTGSFGNTMARHLLSQGYGEVRIFSRDEWKQEEMRLRLSDRRLRFHIGDVRDRSSVDAAMGDVDLVFHAAALKQVPSCEFFPMQAVETNVVGSHNVVESAVSHDVSCVVMLGTDKAVYPVNAMGMTKAVMEKVAQSVARRLGDSATRVCSVRYGNVMCSRGSVIPLFVGQIQSRKAITVTELEMTRFMLPLSEAVRLVEFAFTHANQGDLFVKKAGACTIDTLARALLRMFDFDVPIETIGLRHGEKMHEVLASQAEMLRAEDMGDFLRIPMDARDLNYTPFFTEGTELTGGVRDFDSASAEQFDVDQMIDILGNLPELEADLARV